MREITLFDLPTYLAIVDKCNSETLNLELLSQLRSYFNMLYHACNVFDYTLIDCLHLTATWHVAI